MADYELATRWVIEAPLEAVSPAIEDPERWPEWWPGVRAAEVVEQGDDDGAGQRVRYAFRSALPYTLVFESVVRDVDSPHTVVADVSGDLAGVGRWDVAEEGAVTVLDCTWTVRTTKPAMNALEPFLRPAFVWNHHRIMRRGGEGLADRVGARLLRVEETPRLRAADWAPLVGLGAVGLAAVSCAGRRRGPAAPARGRRR